jgi:RNA polymerase sigma factor (sigma-70 family)
MTNAAFTDAELLAHARRGDETAFAELYMRHESAARRLANTYARAGDPDDLVNGAFERVMLALRKGMGPTDAFRAYLFVTLRRLAADRIARSRDIPCDEIPEPVRAQAHDELDAGERALIVDAYESLPGRWQTVLWHTAVEGRAPRELAPTLGMSANAAAALAYRAREKLRQAYLQAHLQTTPRPECEPHRSRLGAYVRDGLGPRDRKATADHIDECSSCHGLVAELADVNRLLLRSLFPIFVGVGEVATALASATATVTAAAGAAAGAGAGSALRGATDLGRRTLSKARSNPGAASAVVGALLVVAVIAGALISARGDRVALPGSPPAGDEAAPAGPVPPDDGPESPEMPLEITPPRRATPISSSSEQPPAPPSSPPTTTGPTRAPSVVPSTSPPSSATTTPTTRPPAPPSSPPPNPPGATPPPEVPPTPPPSAGPPPSPPPPPAAPPTTRPPPDAPCQVQVQIGGIFDIVICLDLSLLERQSGGRGLKFSQ